MLEDKLYTLSEVAKVAKVTDRTIRNYLSNGTITGQKIGGQWRFTREDVKKLFSTDIYYSDRKQISEGKIQEYVERKISFTSKRTACVVIDINDMSKEETWELHKKIDAIAKDEDVIEKVSFFDVDGHMRLNIIASLSYIEKVIQLIK